MPNIWNTYLSLADEWLVEYSLPPHTSRPKIFAAGFAVELYLKAAHTKMYGNDAKAIKAGHDIGRLLSECKQADGAFLPAFELRPNILAANPLLLPPPGPLSSADFQHFMEHQPLYTAAIFQGDLKYLGTKLKLVKGSHAYTYSFPENYWIPFFREIRAYLGYPEAGGLDMIKIQMDQNDLPDASLHFLRQLY